MKIRLAILGTGAIAAATLLTACSSSGSSPAGSAGSGSTSDRNMSTSTDMSSGAGTSGGMNMNGMSMASGTGLSTTVNGYTLSTGHITAMAGMTMPVTFTITKNGKTVTQFDTEQTKLMHFYLIRSDLTGFQHLHPTLAADGTWSVTPASIVAGTYRFFVQFVPHADAADGALVLSRTFAVAGADATTSAPLPAASTTTTVDGYAVKVAGNAMAGHEVPLTITITRNGTPVTDLQPYLDTYAHVTAIHARDLAFAHLHPLGTVKGDHGGPTLTVNADLGESGDYRLFIQFQTAGVLHTASLTVSAG